MFFGIIQKMILLIALFSVLTVSDARPSDGVSIQNVITVPPNCPSGQEWVNGQCREVWKNGVNPANVVTVPPNCSGGQVFVNGQCKDIWYNYVRAQLTRNTEQSGIIQPEDQRRSDAAPSNVVTVPPNCPVGQEYVNGQCREIWFRNPEEIGIIQPQHEPLTWRSGAAPSNVVTVPPNCPVGQEYVSGQCREIWLRQSNQQQNIPDNSYQTNSEVTLPTIEDRNVISVPNQCPDGYKPDALGFCREVLPL